MRYKFIQLLILAILIPWIGCSDDDFEENSHLKEYLQGTWKWVGAPTYWTQVTFNDHTMSWYDSTVIMYNDLEGEIQSIRGQCPVKFIINDGSIGYKFNGVKETPVLWALINEGENSTVVDYKIENGIVSDGVAWRASQPSPGLLNTCFVILKDDRNTVDFCSGGGLYQPVGCVTYHK